MAGCRRGPRARACGRRTRRAAGGRGAARVDAVAEGGQAGVLADGGGARLAELDAVVLRGVVARGEHRAGEAERPGGEVEEVGAGETGEDGVDALARHALGERGG